MRLLLKLAVFLLLIAALLAAMIWQTRRANHQAWLDYQAAAAARGDRLELEAYIPPPIPDAENFAATPAIAAWFDYTVDPVTKKRLWRGDDPRKLTDSLSQLVYPSGPKAPRGFTITHAVRENLPARAAFVIGDTNLAAANTREAASAILAHLSTNNALRSELVAALSRPRIRFGNRFDVRPLYTIDLTYARMTKTLGRVLSLHALACLELGDSDSATDDIRVTLRLAQGLQREPLLISLLLAASTVSPTHLPLCTGLVDHRFSETQLSRLAGDLAQVDFITANALCWRGERAFGLDGIREFETHPGTFQNAMDPWDDEVLANSGVDVWGHPWITSSIGFWDMSRLSVCRGFTTYLFPHLDVARRQWDATGIKAAQDTIEKLPTRPRHIFTRLTIANHLTASSNFARAQAFVDLARTACALERHRLAHGVFPASLTNITALLEGPLPHDVITGAPLTYRLEPDGSFLLYQCGWDGLNHGGDPAHDWVWPSKLKDPVPLAPP
jgi:hypothetical protein